MTKAPDFDIRTLDLGTYFAPFGRRQMPDKAIWLLSLASSVLPENSVGAEVWLARVSGTTVHDGALRQYARELADAFGTGEFRPKRGKRRRVMFASYSPRWGHVAAEDGLWKAIDGRAPSARARAEALGCDREAFGNLRELIKLLVLMQAAQYEDALRWAVRACRVGEIDLDALTTATLSEA